MPESSVSSRPGASATRAPATSQAPVYALLVLSGSTSLVYELLWTRILSFSFGSTSLAFAAVLAVFFLGLAGGAVLGGKAATRLRNPLRAYGVLELIIGAYAGASFPLLFQLHHLFSLHNAGGAEPSGVAFRFAAAAAVLAVPTLAMGATFPILLEHLHRGRSHLSEALGRLYGINTLGAFLGVYAATHWLIPYLGLDRANYVTVALNVLIFAAAWAAGARARAGYAHPPVSATAPEPSGEAVDPAVRRRSRVALLLLAASGCTTLAYEVVWGRVLTIALEGSLYGIGTTLGSFLAGIGLGGLAFSLLARRLSDPSRLFRAYVAACLAMVAYLACSRLLLPVEGYLLKAVNLSMRGLAGLHLQFAIGVLFLLPVTAALGFMFPAAVALHGAGRRSPAEGAGKAYALNTCMSVLGSLCSASFLMDRLGIEGIVYLGALLMLGTLVASVLLLETERKPRMAWLLATALPLLLAAGWWPSLDARTVLSGFSDGRPPSAPALFQSLAANFGAGEAFKVYKDGVGTTLTVTLSGRTSGIQSNGLPQSGRSLDPPHFNLESSLVGLFPALHKPEGRKALVVGLGAGITVAVLRKAGIPKVEVVELEPSMAAICRGIYPEGKSPLHDTGVTLHLDDARNFLVRNRYRENPGTWDIIASQPAHPWVSGAADLFTEEMFRLAYANLAEGGVFCQWFMDGGVDASGLAALANSFGRVFDRVTVYRTYGALRGLYFIGTRGAADLSLEAAERLFARPELRQLLELNSHPRPADVFKYALMGLEPGSRLVTGGGPANRDGNAYVESRMPLIPKGRFLTEAAFEPYRFPGPVPAGMRAAGARETLFVLDAIDRLSGNLPAVLPGMGDSAQSARLAAFARHAPEPFQTYYGVHLALAAGRLGPEALALEADKASHPLLRQQLRLLRLRMWPAPPGPALPEGLDSLPQDFRERFRAEAMLSLAKASRFDEAAALAAAAHGAGAAGPLVARASRLVRMLAAHASGSASTAALDDLALDSLYRDCLRDWPHEAAWLEALEDLLAARGRRDLARMAARTRVEHEAKGVDRLLERSRDLRRAGRGEEARRLLTLAVDRDPGNVSLYMAQAEILGARKDRASLDSLGAAIRRVMPVPDVALARIEEAYEVSARGQGTKGRPASAR